MKQASDCWALLSFRRFLIQRVEIGSGSPSLSSHSNVLEKAPTLFSFCFETELNEKLVDKLQSKWMYGQLTPENSKVGFLLESCSQLFWSQGFHLDVASKARRKDCRYKSKNCEARHSHAWQQDFLVFALHILSLPWFGSLPPLWEFLSLLRLVYPPLMCSSAVKPPPHWTGFMFRLTHPPYWAEKAASCKCIILSSESASANQGNHVNIAKQQMLLLWERQIAFLSEILTSVGYWLARHKFHRCSPAEISFSGA